MSRGRKDFGELVTQQLRFDGEWILDHFMLVLLLPADPSIIVKRDAGKLRAARD